MPDPVLPANPAHSSPAALSAPASVSASREELRRWYGLMHMARILDDRAPNFLKQGLGWSYHAPCAGHDGIQIALGTTFRPGRDWLFPYYRDLATCLAAGITPEEILLKGMSKATDLASGGRHMSNHFAKFALRIQNVSSCVANHALHAVGLARAIKTYGEDGIVFCSTGESSTSEVCVRPCWRRLAGHRQCRGRRNERGARRRLRDLSPEILANEALAMATRCGAQGRQVTGARYAKVSR